MFKVFLRVILDKTEYSFANLFQTLSNKVNRQKISYTQATQQIGKPQRMQQTQRTRKRIKTIVSRQPSLAKGKQPNTLITKQVFNVVSKSAANQQQMKVPKGLFNSRQRVRSVDVGDQNHDKAMKLLRRIQQQQTEMIERRKVTAVRQRRDVEEGLKWVEAMEVEQRIKQKQIKSQIEERIRHRHEKVLNRLKLNKQTNSLVRQTKSIYRKMHDPPEETKIVLKSIPLKTQVKPIKELISDMEQFFLQERSKRSRIEKFQMPSERMAKFVREN